MRTLKLLDDFETLSWNFVKFGIWNVTFGFKILVETFVQFDSSKNIIGQRMDAGQENFPTNSWFEEIDQDNIDDCCDSAGGDGECGDVDAVLSAGVPAPAGHAGTPDE